MSKENGTVLDFSGKTLDMTIDPKIFLVDDDAFSLFLYEQHLQNLGYTSLYLFSSGNELLDNLHLNPDLVFLDYNLGDYQGLELLHAIKSLQPSTTVVILSGQQDMDITIKLMNKGAFDYIIKDEWATERITDVMGKYVTTAEYMDQVAGLGRGNTDKKYLNLIADAQEKVRKEISNELHDNITQLLGASKLYIDSAKLDEHNRLNLLDESKNMLESAIQEVRQLSHNLHGITLKNTCLNTTIQKLVKQLEQNNITVKNKIEQDHLDQLSAHEQHQLVRVFQELVNNMIKYAHATQVVLQTEWNDREISCTIRDNGAGFDAATAKRGIGLENIAQRISALKGDWHLQTSPGNGCEWTIRIPVQQTSGNTLDNQDILYHI